MSTSPICPHCEHEMDTEEMLSESSVDLFALAPQEAAAAIHCPACGHEFWVQGGYTPHYDTAISEEELT